MFGLGILGWGVLDLRLGWWVDEEGGGGAGSGGRGCRWLWVFRWRRDGVERRLAKVDGNDGEKTIPTTAVLI